MSSIRQQIAEMETKYRRARFTIICHLVFLVAVFVAGAVARRALGFSTMFLATALIVALVVFGGDIMKFLYCRNELRRLRGD
jgi:hypothetical protein